MRKLIYILLFAFTLSGFAETPKETLESMRKAKLELSSVYFKCIRMMKPKNRNDYYVDTIYVNVKRDKSIPVLSSKIRIQYENGNFSTFDGKTFKTMLVNENKLLIVDSTQNPSRFITGNWLKDAINIMISGDSTRINYASPKFEFDKPLENVMFDQTECIYVGYNFKDMVAQPKAGFPQIKSVRSDLLIGKNDKLIRRVHSEILFDDSTNQIDNYFYLDVRPNIPLEDNMFDIQPMDETIVEMYKPEEPVKLLEVGTEAPAFTLIDETGKEVRLSDYKGKIIIVDFWGTWCKWCIKTMPAINKVAETFKNQDLIVLGISCNEPPNADPVQFMKRNNYNYKCLVKGNEVAKSYNVTGYPTMYIIGKDGRIAKTVVGFSDSMEKDIEEIIIDLLK
jgi:peroxiredoxin